MVDRSGKPLAGFKVAPLSALAPRGRGGKGVRFPDVLAESMAGLTDNEGRAEVRGIGPKNTLAGPRISSPEIGTQLIRLQKRGDGPTWEGVLDRAGTLSGTVSRRDGGAVDGLVLSLEAQYSEAGYPLTVTPPSGPIRVGKDGSFRTPDCLIAGVRYRVMFRGEGVVPAQLRWSRAQGRARSRNGRP